MPVSFATNAHTSNSLAANSHTHKSHKAMRLTKFNELMTDEFGSAYSSVLLQDLVLGSLGDKTGAQLIAAGEDPRKVWLAICETQSVPKDRWHGRNTPKKA